MSLETSLNLEESGTISKILDSAIDSRDSNPPPKLVTFCLMDASLQDEVITDGVWIWIFLVRNLGES